MPVKHGPAAGMYWRQTTRSEKPGPYTTYVNLM